MKRCFLIVTILFLANYSYSQTNLDRKFMIGLDGGVNIPTSSNRYSFQPYTYGLTIGVSGKYFIKPKLGLGLSSGIYHYPYKSNYSNMKMSIIPVLLSTEYNFNGKKIRPYLGFDLGVYFYKERKEFDALPERPRYVLNSSDTFFGIVPSLGLRCLFNEKISANLSLKYINIFLPRTSFPNVNLSIGVNYSF